MKSSNFFAALGENSDDEEVVVAPTKTVVSGSSIKENSANANHPKTQVTLIEPSKVDDRKRQDNHDRDTKHERGGRVPAREDKRAYDRRSGTGRGKEIKKGGDGAHNWGSDQYEAKLATRGESVDKDAADTADEDADGQAVEEVGTKVKNDNHHLVVKEDKPEPEAEDNTMSYEEYLALQKEKKSELLIPVKERTVEANEFANLQPATRQDEDNFLAASSSKPKRKKASNTTVTSAADFLGSLRVKADSDSERAGRERYGRGRDGRGRGGHGGRGRESGRFGRGGEDGGGRGRRGSGRGRFGGGPGRASINVNDERAFPSL